MIILIYDLYKKLRTRHRVYLVHTLLVHTLNKWSDSYCYLSKFIGLFFIGFCLVVACHDSGNYQNSTSHKSQRSDRLTIGTTLKLQNIDPAATYGWAGINVVYNLSNTLYANKLGRAELEPQLATEMPEISENNLLYKIPLRKGVTFHDGTPFNAEAMKFSLERFIKNGGKPSFLLSELVESVEATGEYELSIKLKQPFSGFTAILAFPGTCAVSPKAYEIGKEKFNPKIFVGTGPYKLAEYNTDSIRLDVFEDYWGEKPANKGVDMQIYADNPANLFNSFRTHAVDIAYRTLEPEQIKSLQKGSARGDWQGIEASGTSLSYMVLNLRQEPLNKLEVRQAIAALVKRSSIVQRVFQNQVEPVYSLLPTVFNAYKPVFEEAYGDGDYDRAKELLKKAGYSAENPAIVEIWYPAGSKTYELVAVTLRALADKELDGALVFEIESVDTATAASNLSKGVYPSFLLEWYPDFLDPDNYIQPFLDCDRGSEVTGCKEGAAQSLGSFFYSDRANKLIDAQRQERDPEARHKILAELQDILAREIPYIPLWQNKDFVFAHNGLEGITTNPSQYLPFWTIRK
ncbi:MAG: peptide ABC transporter substrate-binding protein [Moorea sp. SIO3I7]|nr:ABC transporter substrate-binding protein [Moorena sp. SIO3I8]NEN94005.1 peptide ABC transporter substrate-binding protein [Moorena sp. SIO3I7]NEO18183.1 peptide ABC transporter substrate-binding protein [Moorena sp. SIO4A5]NEP21578.1 peptide ABC transporter substrate-binding protein [Moorena sp. SIO3I6]NEQ60438.1 peptide ABC transporter substrate-binding protein [Moorena sp. SIO4A1]NEO05208.1 peptide ABC transporter substrate-binding protein [Moorena sp. SIO3I8]